MTTIKSGDTVKIKPEWLDSPEEADYIYNVLSDPNSNNRIDIRHRDSKLSLPGIESVKVEYVDKQ
jgi:hypothetical protein